MIRWTAFLLVLLVTLGMPWDPFLTNRGLVPVPTLWLLTPVMLLLSIGIVLRQRSVSRPVLRWLLVLAVVVTVAGVSVAWAHCSVETSVAQLATLVYLFLQAISFLFLASRAGFTPGLYAVLLGGSAVGLLGIGLAQGTVLHGSRIIPTEAYNPTWLGGYAAVSGLLALDRTLRCSRPFGWTLLAGTMVAVLLWTQSRNASLAIVLAVGTAIGVTALRRIYSFQMSKPGRRAVAIAGATVLASAALVAGGVFLFQRFGLAAIDLTRFALLLSDDPYMATAGRSEMWTRMGGAMSSPWGVGIGCFGESFTNVYGYERLPHNQWLYTFGELGFVGLGMMILATLVAVYYGLRFASLGLPVACAVWFFVPLMTIGNDVMFYQYWWAAVFAAALLLRDMTRGRAASKQPIWRPGHPAACASAIEPVQRRTG